MGPNSYGLYSTVGNTWEWTQCPLTPDRKDELTLKGGSFVDSIDGSFNHMATVVTRMGVTADSGTYNTGFRCAKGVGGGGRKVRPSQEEMQKIVAERGVEGLQEFLGSGFQVKKGSDIKSTRTSNEL